MPKKTSATKKPKKITKGESINTVPLADAPKTLVIGALTLKKRPVDSFMLEYVGRVALGEKHRLDITLVRSVYEGKPSWRAYAVTRDLNCYGCGATAQLALKVLIRSLVSRHKYDARQANDALRCAETAAAEVDRISQVCAYVAALA